MATDWYFAKQGQQHGPISSQEVKANIQQGKIARGDLVWCEGMAEWTAAGRLQALAALFPVAHAAEGAAVMAHQPVAGSHVPMEQGLQTSQVMQASVAQHAQSAQTLSYNNPRGHAAGQAQLTQYGLELLRGTRPWTRLVGVVLFVACGLLVAISLLIIVLSLGTASMGPRGAGIAGGAGAILGVFYILFGLLYFFPGLYLNRFANRVTDLINQPDERALERVLEAQRSFWRFVGIALLVVLCLNGVFLLFVLAAGGLASMR